MKMDDLGVPLFLETPICNSRTNMFLMGNAYLLLLMHVAIFDTKKR